MVQHFFFNNKKKKTQCGIRKSDIELTLARHEDNYNFIVMQYCVSLQCYTNGIFYSFNCTFSALK